MAQVVVVGAGAAGLFAAGRAVERGHGVTLVEHMDAPGKKLAITGKGRCNLTNRCDEQEFLRNLRRNPKFLYAAIHSFPPAEAMLFFERELGLPLKVERGRRVFPQSDRAEDVVQALTEWAAGARPCRGRAVEVLQKAGRAVGVRLQDGRVLNAEAVLLATGGASYPATGAMGLGYALAEGAGHHIVPPEPSLVALVEKGGECAKMAGLSLRNVGLTMYKGQKPVFQDQGELLFTHFGLSGPLVLSASAWVEDPKNQPYTASIDLKPGLSADKLEERVLRDFGAMPNKDAAHSLDKLAPASLRPVLLTRWGTHPAQKVNQITKDQRRALVALLKDFRIPIARKGDLDHAVITSGGVDVKEVDPKTMQSKKLPGLYFAGEILDVDGYTGGYNLQIAWATAEVAALHF